MHIKRRSESHSNPHTPIVDSKEGQCHHIPAVHKRGRPWHSEPGPAWSLDTAVESGTHMAALGTHVLVAVLKEVPVVASMG